MEKDNCAICEIKKEDRKFDTIANILIKHINRLCKNCKDSVSSDTLTLTQCVSLFTDDKFKQINIKHHSKVDNNLECLVQCDTPLKEWKDFTNFKEIPIVEYYDDLYKFISTKEGKVCEAMSIINAHILSHRRLYKGDINVTHFDELLSKYMGRSKFDLSEVPYKDERTIKDLEKIKSHQYDPMWNLCIYSGCNIVNTVIMYPFLRQLYPHDDIKLIESHRHTFVVNMTTKKIYDLSMWSEFSDSIMTRLINSPKIEVDSYGAHNDIKVINKFLIDCLWLGNKDPYTKVLEYCNSKYK
jgi:hypothetical protein